MVLCDEVEECPGPTRKLPELSRITDLSNGVRCCLRRIGFRDLMYAGRKREAVLEVG
jgi:hypothetical protein